MEKYVGKITKVYYREESYVIALFKTEQKEDFTIKGHLLGIAIGEKIEIYGTSEIHNKYGKQCKVSYWERPIPKGKEQVIEFLQSSAVKGCGKKYARSIVSNLGENALNTIVEQGYECLVGIRGINEKRAKTIAESIKDSLGIQEALRELQQYGIDIEMVIKAFNIYKNNTVQLLKSNPYKLMEVAAIPFFRADEIAKNIGILPLSKVRVSACIQLVLQQKCYNAGHCFINENELIESTKRILNHNVKDHSNLITNRDEYEIIAAIEEFSGLINDKGNVYPKKLYEAEKNVAMKVTNFIATQIKEHLNTNLLLSNLDEKIKEYQVKQNTVLAENQRDAIKKIMKHDFMILTGGPGTGKTYTVKGIIEVFKSVYPDKKKIVLTALSGRAARNLYEATGIADSFTVHLLLGYKHGEEPEYNKNNPLPFDLIVVDEFSMMDIILASHFLDAIGPNTKILFVGDPDQLPSVGPGNVLKDLLDVGVPHVRLTDIYRQAQASQIVTNAHRIKNGKPIIIDPEKNDYYLIEKQNPQSIAQTIQKSVNRFIELGYDISEIMVLSPMKKGEIGVNELNVMLQKQINPPADSKKEIVRKGIVFREGDKIMQLINNRNKEVYNGDIGIIKAIEETKDNETLIYCSFNSRLVAYKKDELNELQHAYCTTIHKCQGSQAPIVIMPMSMIHERMLVRNLFYTGQTRAKERVVLVGSMKAINKAIVTDKVIYRNSCLKQRIHNYLKLANVNISNG